jgi:hypothetical protein
VIGREKMVWINIGSEEHDVGVRAFASTVGKMGVMICFSLELRQLTMLYDAG